MADDFFARMRLALEPSYVAATTPWQQSGFSGPEARWIALRKPVADAIDGDGAFLDIGCANGYLLECVRRWVGERGLTLELSGIDLSPPLVELARQRLPDSAGRLVIANALDWEPPRRYDFVRTELVYVPAEREAEYLGRLRDRFLAPGGALLVCNYTEDHPDADRRVIAGSHVTRKLADRLAALGFPTTEFRDGHDAVKGRRVRVAILRKQR